MSMPTIFGPRRLGLVAATALMASLATTGAASAAPASASVPSASASASASVANATLTITGTQGDDRIALIADADPNKLQVSLSGSSIETFDRTTFNAISVFLENGNDRFFEPSGVFADETLTVDGGRGDDVIDTGDGNDFVLGGSGNDTIHTGSGNDLIVAGRGDDFVNGGVGVDTAFLGSGRDTFEWNPGDGSDVIDGGSGYDTMAFNGSAANEIMSLSANGPRAVFLRNVGGIRMDTDNVEALDLKAVGGADTVTVGDMSGTDFRQANIDLTGTSGDSAVTVNGTEHADHIRVDADGSKVDVSGLKTQTQITGSGVKQHLQVNSLGGNDKVEVNPDASALIGVTVDLGAGQH